VVPHVLDGLLFSHSHLPKQYLLPSPSFSLYEPLFDPHVFSHVTFVYQSIKDSNYDAVIDLLESIEQSVNRLNAHMTISQAGVVSEVIEKVTLELLSILALVTKRMKQKRSSKSVLSDIPLG
jgi:hypothetical protein